MCERGKKTTSSSPRYPSSPCAGRPTRTNTAVGGRHHRTSKKPWDSSGSPFSATSRTWSWLRRPKSTSRHDANVKSGLRSLLVDFDGTLHCRPAGRCHCESTPRASHKRRRWLASRPYAQVGIAGRKTSRGAPSVKRSYGEYT